MPGPVVATTEGLVEGSALDGVTRFLGIPYAAPPVGALRFAAPAPPPAHDGVRPAHVAAPPAPQPASPLESFLSEGRAVPPSEAGCLALNVWTPAADAGRRPVMVFVHGGGFVWGSSDAPIYEGTRLASAHDVVVVSCNYRLGALGFTAIGPDAGPGFRGSGSVGVQDVAAALAWVRDNVASFGGDPGNVTLFGESAGAMSVATLLGMPAARGLFHKAILESGAASNVALGPDALAITAELAAVLGVGADLASLQAVDVERLVAAQAEVSARHTRDGLAWRPVVDGVHLPRPPLDAVADGEAVGVPLLIGTNLDEWRLFSTFDPGFATQDDATATAEIARLAGDPELAGATYRKRLGDVPLTRVLECAATDAYFRVPATRLAEAQDRAGGAVWSYLFSWPSALLGACHGLELPFVFDTLDTTSGALLAGAEAPRALATQVQATWAAFARHGDPSAGPLGDWRRYDVDRRATMVFDVPSRLVDDPLRDERVLFDG
jgi:para-nitrobenzyl esterase